MSLNDRFGPPKPLRAVPDPDQLAQAIAAHPAGKQRGQRWAHKKLADQAAELARMPANSGRNDTLNAIAYSCGRLIPGGWLDEQQVRDVLEHAGMASGLEHGETMATVDSGVSAGILDPRDPPITLEQPVQASGASPGWDANTSTPATTANVDVPANVDPATGEILRTTWWPKDLTALLNGDDDGEPPPACLRRNDEQHLLYAGKINALIGESESGKSWIALLATVQTLQAGDRATYLDFEDTAPGVIDRLRLLGASTQDLSRLAYISPLDAYTAQAQGDLTQHLTAHQPTLIAFDGINAAMTLLGLNLLDNMDYTSFSLTVLRPLARTGAAVVTVDHVTKSKEGRGAYAIGAQAKRADIDGCALMVEVERPFGRGMTGRLKLTVSKDRPGHVRAVSSAGKKAGTVVLVSTTDAIHGTIEAPDLRPADERGPFRPTHLMQKVSEYLELVGDGGASKANIEREVSGGTNYVRKAVEILVSEGYVALRTEARGALVHSSIRPFRDDLATSPLTSPHLASGEVSPRSNDLATSPPRLYGGEVEVSELASGEDDDNEPDEWWKK